MLPNKSETPDREYYKLLKWMAENCAGIKYTIMMAENSRMSKLSEKDDECIFSWKLFTAWDYMIGNAETAHNRVASIVMGFKEALLEEAEKKKDTRNWRVIGCRVFVNMIVIGLLSLSVYLIIIVVNRSTQTDSQSNFWRKNETSFVIALITFFFPMVFEVLGLLEQYHPRKQLRLQLARIMVLNLLNLYSLIFALFDRISGMTEKLEQKRSINRTLHEYPILYTPPSPNLTAYYNETCQICGNYQPSSLIAESLISGQAQNRSLEILPQLWNLFQSVALNDTLTDFLNGTFLDNSTQYQNETLFNVTSGFYFETNSTDAKQMFVDYLTYILYSLGDFYSTIAPDGNYSTLGSNENYTTLISDYNYSTMITDEYYNTTVNSYENYTGVTHSTYTSSPLSFETLSTTILLYLKNITELTIPTELTSSTELTKLIELIEAIMFDQETRTDDLSSTMSTTVVPECTGCRKVWIPYNMNYTMEAELRSLCWETMFGQELVKLTVTDLIMSIVPTLGMEFFRGIFVRVMNRCWCWDLEKRFPQYGDFKVAENILSLVNNQGMVWMGMFFSPGIVTLNVLKLYILMYFRGWAVMTCNSPPEVIFRASRSHNFYYALLLMMLFLCVLPVGYTIVWIRPSWHCGPFSKYERIFHIFTNTITENSPEQLRRVLYYIASPGIVIPLLVLLTLIIYYLISLTNALREANDDLKIQLRRERTEERRKMFQMSDRRRRVGSGESNELSNTPFSKWKKVLGTLPSGKSMDETTPKQELDDIQEPSKEENGNKGRDFFTKLIKRALGKSSTSEDEQNIEDGTDNEQNESLPYDSVTSKKPLQRATKRTFWNNPDFHSIAKKAMQLNENKQDLNVNKNETSSEVKRAQQQEKPSVSRQNSDLRKDVHRRDPFSYQIEPSTSKCTRQDSVSSIWSDNIPVITISKTESAENILENSNKDKSDKDARRRPQHKFTPRIKCVLKKQSTEVDEETIRYFSNDLEKTQKQNEFIKALKDDVLDGEGGQKYLDNSGDLLEEPLTDRSSSEGTEYKEISTDTILRSPMMEKEDN
ncbi:hypothetical protein JTB14_013229 [Gonioctena quinquepunctata]|nr:hypothetical protein JTB14_013229 [Gonioctena quinquepunctata]